MRRWLKPIALGLFAAAVLAITGAVILIHTDWGRGVVKGQIEDALIGQFPGGVHVGAIEFGVFGEIVVRDVRIDLPDHRPELTVGEARISLARLPLFGKTVRIERLELDDVAFTVPPPAPPKPPGPPGEPSPWQIEVDDLEIHRARVSHPAAEVTDLEVAAMVRFAGGELTGVVTATARYAGQDVSVLGMGRYARGEISVPLARVTAAGARASVIGARISGGMARDGALLAVVPAAAARELAQIELPGDGKAVVSIHEGALALDAVLGERSARAMLGVDVERPALKGLVIANDPRGMAVAAIDASPAGIQGIVSGYFDDLRGAVAVDGTPHGGLIAAGVRGSRIHGGVFAELVRAGDTWTVKRSHVVGNVHDIGQLRGELAASLSATGRAWPDPDLRIAGAIDGDHAGWGQLSAARLHVVLSDVHAPAHPRGAVHVEVDGAARGATPLGSLRLDAHGEGELDGTGRVVVDSHELQPASGAAWAGTGGTVVIGEQTIAITGFHTASGSATIDVDGKLQRDGADLGAKLVLGQVPLAAFAPGVAGTIGGQLAVARRRGAWSGGGALHAGDLVVSGQAFAGDVDLALAGRRVTLHASAASALGSAKVALDVDGPRDLTDAAAWLALDRRALREASLELDHVTVGGVTTDGKIAVAATSAGGALRFSGVRLRGGEVAGQVGLEHVPNGDLEVIATAHDGPARVAANAMVDLPMRLFDPAAWRGLGRGALRSATITVPELAFDPDVLAKLGVIAPYRGKVAATIDVAAGGTGAKASIQLTGLTGGMLIAPVDVAVDGSLDDAGLAAKLTASSRNIELATIDAHSPFTLAYGDIRRAPLTATVTFPDTPAKSLLALFGRTDITDGRVAGTIDVAGTIGTPTAHAQLAAHDIAIAQGLASKKPVVLRLAAIDAKWGGTSGSVELTGDEANGGSLRVSASGRPDAPSSIAIEVEAKKFDLAPLAALAPGPLVAAAGVLDASLAVRGLDPQSGDVRGELHLSGGRLPLSPQIGTIRRAQVDVTVAGGVVDTKLTAKLGPGDITGTGKLVMTGGRPSSAQLDLKVRGISPVGAVEPVISADVTGRLAYAERWTGKIKVSHTTIAIPSTERDALLDTGAPSDMVFVDAPPPIPKGLHRAAPTHPWLVATVDLGTTHIEAENLRDVASAHVDLDGQLVVSVGDGVGYEGSISCRRGDISILGRGYVIDHAGFVFDGSLDPLLDVRLVHDFPEVSLTADVHGRSSMPDLALSSDPAIYTDSQLLGFFLGGEPGGDPSSASTDAAAGAGTSFLSTKAGSFVKNKLSKVVPVRLDVLDYQAGTSSTSGAVRAGVWVSRKLYVQYRGRPDARPDENSNEGNLEYYLPRNWFLQAVIGDHDVDGLDLLHRWRW